MNDKEKISRRSFLRGSIQAGGALMFAGALPVQAAGLFPVREHAATNDLLADGSTMNGSSADDPADELLKGVCDIHLHANPDSSARSVNEWSFAVDARRAGYRAVMFKSNDFSCHDRAYLIRQALPDFEVFGSFCMNRVHGERVNVYAVEKAVATTGGLCRCIWMPTLDAAYQYRSMGRKEKGIPVVDDGGQVLPEVVRAMEICAEADIIFATGHSSPEESIALAQKAREVGVGRFVVTHANSHWWIMTPDQIRECVDSGAYIEYCYLPCLWGEGTQMPQYERQTAKRFADFVRIAPERSFISTDLGQAVMPHPVEGMRQCIKGLLEAGFTQREIDRLVRANPAYLIGLDHV